LFATVSLLPPTDINLPNSLTHNDLYIDVDPGFNAVIQRIPSCEYLLGFADIINMDKSRTHSKCPFELAIDIPVVVVQFNPSALCIFVAILLAFPTNLYNSGLHAILHIPTGILVVNQVIPSYE
jgi:hypothetical protein